MGIWNDCSKDGALGFGELSWDHHELVRQTRFRLSEDSTLREMVRMHGRSLLSLKKVRTQDFGKSSNGRFWGGGFTQGLNSSQHSLVDGTGTQGDRECKVQSSHNNQSLLRILYLRQRRET